MGPSQICGCPFREPRVFTIAHIYTYTYIHIYIHIFICMYFYCTHIHTISLAHVFFPPWHRRSPAILPLCLAALRGENGRGHSPNSCIFLGTFGEMIHFNLAYCFFYLFLFWKCFCVLFVVGSVFVCFCVCQPLRGFLTGILIGCFFFLMFDAFFGVPVEQLLILVILETYVPCCTAVLYIYNIFNWNLTWRVKSQVHSI